MKFPTFVVILAFLALVVVGAFNGISSGLKDKECVNGGGILKPGIFETHCLYEAKR